MAETSDLPAMNLRYESNVLDQQQLARIGALHAARSALVNKGAFSSGAADPIDLVQVARYIETGVDPYSSPIPVKAAD